MTKEDMRKVLLQQWGCLCWGCGFEPPGGDDRHLELDRNQPKAGGGSNNLDNRAMLCGPCNRAKSNILTLAGLRKENKRKGHWYKDMNVEIPLLAVADWARNYLATTAQQGRFTITVAA